MIGTIKIEYSSRKYGAMAKNTSVLLGDHFANFVDDRVKNGRYA
jgi:Bacterial antitoxin of ParD toxin-antitoxin type II system and RHH